MSLETIDAKAKVLAAHRDILSDLVAALKAGQDELHRDHLPGIKRELKRVFQLDAELKALVGANPEVFTKPRTLVLHGLKVGFAKGKGKVLFSNAETVVKLIKRKLPDLAEQLIDVKESPAKSAIAKLTVDQLKAIGCSVTSAGDQIVVTAVDTAVDKLVDALLKSLGDKARADEDEAAEAA
jgi:hypothetical protein